MDLSTFSQKTETIKAEAAKALIGQQKMLDLLLTALFARGHVLIEGVPGVAKTLTSRLMAAITESDFKRIQFTPDLMPSDILGTSIFNLKEQNFEYKKGPVFANLVLIDEINRAPAKTQASLFEVMEEKQVTNDGIVYPMEGIFMVIATQNPVEQEGTYKLPEAQLDRFLFKINVDYPTLEEEQQILELINKQDGFKKLAFIEKVLSKEEVAGIQEFIGGILIKPDLLKYIATLVQHTREHPSLYLGASPRASIDLMNASRAFAAIKGRDYTTPEDIQYLLRPVIEHRVVLTPEAELQGVTLEEISRQIIQQVEVPK
ncbi:MAG: MoxR family ATPase [Cytophagales bacterium]|nr:MoxR family ATPase [Cytophagales bacterium]